MNTKQLDKWITMLKRIKDEMDDVTNDLNDIHFGSNLSRIADRLNDACEDLEDFRVDVPDDDMDDEDMAELEAEQYASDYDDPTTYDTCPKCGQETCNDVCPECGDMTDPQNPSVRE